MISIALTLPLLKYRVLLIILDEAYDVLQRQSPSRHSLMRTRFTGSLSESYESVISDLGPCIISCATQTAGFSDFRNALH